MVSKTLTFSTIAINAGLKAALEMAPAAIIAQVAASGIRGRGGAGFPVGVKWELAAAAPAGQKYILCNADEGEPGTFKDRVILSDYSDLVAEGMTISARAIGATKGIVYLRGEYAYLRAPLTAMLEARRDAHLLGRAIGEVSGFDFEIEIRMGSGAYVCGEETALIESLEGRRGEPRNRPPYPVANGFLGCPTVVNNVETLAWIACIFAKGSEWFNRIGTHKSTGLKLLSVSGDCDRPGVYEFSMGISIKRLLDEVGGGGAKAVQVGGASGQCVPASEFDRTVAFEDVPTGGSIIVIGPERRMIDVAENFMEFFVDESCGQCTSCREGNVKLLQGVQLLKKQECSMSYLLDLCALGETMRVASKCGLGQSSPNAFLSIVKHFKEEIMGARA